jgi:hypothetical protein
MYRTIITHFYNEEYLLPWWLNHHKKYFYHGILIDYASTDRSVEIIKQICPDWTIIPSRNEMFDARLIDEEVMDIEKNIDGWRICLNTTEFIRGNFDILDKASADSFILPCHTMVDKDPLTQPNHNLSLVEQKPHGIKYNSTPGFKNRRPRCIHKQKNIKYPLGRHYDTDPTTDELEILWYGWSPFNEQTLTRKLQIQTRIPESDKAQGFGREHITTRDRLYHEFYTNYFSKAEVV